MVIDSQPDTGPDPTRAVVEAGLAAARAAHAARLPDGPVRLSFDDLPAYEWMNIPAWVFDGERERQCWANAAGLRFWRADSLEELCSRSYAGSSPAAAARIRLSMQAHARGETTFERWTLYPKGVPTSILLQGTGIRLPDGRVGILFMAELGMQAEPNVVRGIEALNHALVQVAVHRLADGAALMRNPSAALAFGAVCAGAPPCNDFVAMFADRELGARLYAQLLRGEPVDTKAMLLVHGAPCWRLIGARVAPDPVTGESIVQFHCIDISELMATQHALELARNSAEAAQRAKATFLATMNHEIRTPLNGMLGMLHVLHRGPLDEKQRRRVGLALQAGTSLGTLLDDAIAFAAMESGENLPQHELIDPRGVIEHAMHPLLPEAQRKGLDLACEVEADVPERIVCDQRWLRLIVFHLVSNAVKFTTAGGVRVAVDVCTTEQDAMALRVEVADTGPGIPPAEQERIFRPFVQLDEGATRRHGGSGMGLALAKGMVQRLGGWCELHSEPAAGSRFTVVLPLS